MAGDWLAALVGLVGWLAEQPHRPATRITEHPKQYKFRFMVKQASV